MKQVDGETLVPIAINPDKNILSYVLITPARNEEAYIAQTIESVVKQTILPMKWVIVSDGSTDGTDDIVRKHAVNYKWIEFLRLPERRDRHFAGKVLAFNAGYAKVKALDYQVIGNIDADISFDDEFMFYLLTKFSENQFLGVSGAPFREETQQYDYRYTNTEHVSGACQLFRRECFEAIGGYIPLKAGGVDLAAVLTARMKGWQTRTFLDKTFNHNKKTQSAKYSSLSSKFRSGYHDYLMGGHLIWQIFRSVYQMSKKPLIIGGCALLLGHLWATVTRVEPIVSKDLVDFRQKEQKRRLRDYFRKLLLPGGHKSP